MFAGMIERARRFNQKFWGDEPSREQRVYWTKENLLSAVVEAGEVLDELAWKTHRPGQKFLMSRPNLREELVDLFKYWLNVWALWGFTEEDLVEEVERKSSVVESRYRGESLLKETTRPVALVDVDGVLADYPASFDQFVYQRSAPYNAGVTDLDMLRLKREYRESGAKAFIGARAGAREMMAALLERYFVVVLSGRPYWAHKRLYGDTLKWLNDNGLAHDALFFTHDKQGFALDLVDKGKRVDVAVEDEVENANRLAKVVSRVYFVDHGDTDWSEQPSFLDGRVFRTRELGEISLREGPPGRPGIGGAR